MMITTMIRHRSKRYDKTFFSNSTKVFQLGIKQNLERIRPWLQWEVEESSSCIGDCPPFLCVACSRKGTSKGDIESNSSSSLYISSFSFCLLFLFFFFIFWLPIPPLSIITYNFLISIFQTNMVLFLFFLQIELLVFFFLFLCYLSLCCRSNNKFFSNGNWFVVCLIYFPFFSISLFIILLFHLNLKI